VEVGGFATSQAYKFNTGMERLNVLIKRSSRGTPDTSQHLRALRDLVAHPNLSLDYREDGDVDVEKTRVWKFRFLDLIIEMVLDGGGDGADGGCECFAVCGSCGARDEGGDGC
jgi:hypothetical protein